MGVDYAEKRAKSYRKGLDNSRIKLGTPDLFTEQPDCASRAYAVRLRKGQAVSNGEKLCARVEGNDVVLLRRLDLVGTFINPPPELTTALTKAHGEGCATVQDSYDMAQTAEVTVC